METILIVTIIALASVYLLRKFARSIQKAGSSQCGCGCTSCPDPKNCDPPAGRSAISNYRSTK